ncbi:MAG: hypothetical protein ABIG20_00950 [archaeon]
MTNAGDLFRQLEGQYAIANRIFIDSKQSLKENLAWVLVIREELRKMDKRIGETRGRAESLQKACEEARKILRSEHYSLAFYLDVADGEKEVKKHQEMVKQLEEMKAEKGVKKLMLVEEAIISVLLDKRRARNNRFFIGGVFAAIKILKDSNVDNAETTKLKGLVEEAGAKLGKTPKPDNSTEMLDEIKNCTRKYVHSITRSDKDKLEIEELMDELRKSFFTGALCAIDCVRSYTPTAGELGGVLRMLGKID